MSVNMEEAVLERNIRRFALVRTAEPVYLELREGLILIRHQSKYGSNLLATFWCRVFQHPNNYPAFKFPYRKLYDTKGLWQILLRIDDVLVTIFTKTGTMTIKGNYVLEWFMDKFQGIMDAVDAPIQHPQPIKSTGKKHNMEDNRRGVKSPDDRHQSNILTNPRNIHSSSRQIKHSSGTVSDRSVDKLELPEVYNAKEQHSLLEAGNKVLHSGEERTNIALTGHSEERDKLVLSREGRRKPTSRPLSGRGQQSDRRLPVFSGCEETGSDPTEIPKGRHEACIPFINTITGHNNETPCGMLDVLNETKGFRPALNTSQDLDSGNADDFSFFQDNGKHEECKPADFDENIPGNNGIAEELTGVVNGDKTQDFENLCGGNFGCNGFDTKTDGNKSILIMMDANLTGEAGLLGCNDDEAGSPCCNDDDTVPVNEQPTENNQQRCDTMDEGGQKVSPFPTQDVNRCNSNDLLIDDNQNGHISKDDNCDSRGEDQQDFGNNNFGVIEGCRDGDTQHNIETVFTNDLIDMEPPHFDVDKHGSNGILVVYGPDKSLKHEQMSIPGPPSNSNSFLAVSQGIISTAQSNEKTRDQSHNGRGDNSIESPVTEDIYLSNGCDGVDTWSVREQLTELNQHLRLQQLDLWYGPSLDTELDQLAIASVKQGNYVYMLWKSLLQKFMSTQNCKLYMASPYLDKPRLQDICHAFLRNRLTACVDGVHVKRLTESGQLISDVKWDAIREFPANEQAVLEYKLYSSFLYPFVEFNYRFLAGVTDGEAHVLITSADFHGNHFETDNLDIVFYTKMSETDFRNRFLNPLME